MKQQHIALISGPENGSPRVLAKTLFSMLIEEGQNAKVFYQAKAFRRLLDAKTANIAKLNWIIYKLLYLTRDKRLFRELKNFDAVIICDWTPNGFYKHTYNIEKLRSIIKKPILYYAIQYLQNSPSIVKKLADGCHAGIERYDWHLTVSEITEIRNKPAAPWNQIGLYLRSTGLKPVEKEQFFAIVDFLRPGYENYRNDQIRALEELSIPYLSLEKSYSIEEIRRIYARSAIIFLQFPEAYGLPIAECLACGSYIGTPDSSWAMAWRLDEKPEVHGPGLLPDCFVVYNDFEELKKKLEELKNTFDRRKTPQKVFDTFYSSYPTFYDGNRQSLNEVIERISKGNFQY